MNELNDLERAVLSKLLDGDHPALAKLREQVKGAKLTKRTNTGVGFYCEFEADGDTPLIERDLHLGDVQAEIPGLSSGAGFVLFVRGGRIATLEGYSYDEPWPRDIRHFSLKYSDPTRKAELAKLE
jgi:hypothetical protein